MTADDRDAAFIPRMYLYNQTKIRILQTHGNKEHEYYSSIYNVMLLRSCSSFNIPVNTILNYMER